MDDDNGARKAVRWSVQLFEFVWNGISGAVVAGAAHFRTTRVK